MKSVNSDLAYKYIRKKILAGEFTPGFPLMTKEIAEEIGISRTPVRDALRQLEADGLVSIRPHLGATVRAMDLKEFKENCGLRLALESYAAGLAAQNRTMEELQELRTSLALMQEFTEKLIAAAVPDAATLDELRKEDIRFHLAIISSAKSDLLKREVLRLHVINRIVIGPSPGKRHMESQKNEWNERRRLVQASHNEIFQAIERSDAASAKLAMERHIQNIIDNSIEQMARAERHLLSRELTEDELSYAS